VARITILFYPGFFGGGFGPLPTPGKKKKKKKEEGNPGKLCMQQL
jgi:hypothetical protein